MPVAMIQWQKRGWCSAVETSRSLTSQHIAGYMKSSRKFSSRSWLLDSARLSSVIMSS